MILERDTNILLQADSPLLYHYEDIEHGAVRLNEMENRKNLAAQALQTEKPRYEEPQKKTQQNITLPSLEKTGFQEAKLWWRRFSQYKKMRQNIDLEK